MSHGFALFRKKSRSLHRWLSFFVALPAVLIFSTGILLLLRQEFAWIQPVSQKGILPGLPQRTIPELLERVSQDPKVREQTVESLEWKMISSVDYKPASGVYAFRFKSGLEIQLDGANGNILSVAQRRTGFLIELHQGSYFHPWVMKYLFVPVGVALLGLWLSGIVLLWKKSGARGV